MSPQDQTPTDLIGQIAAVPSILDVIAKTTGMGFVAVARVTEERWVACAVLDNIDFGLKPGGELRIETTICNEIRECRQAVVINHVAEDAAYRTHHTPAMYGFQSYISMPIILNDGSFFGTLCAIDPRPAQLDRVETVGMFKLFAELIAVHVDARNHLTGAETALTDARSTAELREQFIAVLGHDLRSPLAALTSGIQLLERQPQSAKSTAILKMMSGSARRMSELIGNVLDLAKGRLGGGISLVNESKRLDDTFQLVLDETRTAWPDRDIRAALNLGRPFHGDHGRLGQVFSNLLGNAVKHGASDKPIQIAATHDDKGLELIVANQGAPIPADQIDRLFQPFQRGEGRPDHTGLGLGLFIASEIAKAHGGSLRVSSNSDETRFVFHVPSSPISRGP